MAMSTRNLASSDALPSETVPQRLLRVTERYPDHDAVLSKDADGTFQPTSFSSLLAEVAVLAAGLTERGVARGDHVGLICDTRKEWLLFDLALLGLGAVDVPRGSDSSAAEIVYILGHADCQITCVEDAAQLAKLAGIKDRLPQLHTAIVLDPAGIDNGATSEAVRRGLRVVTIDDLRHAGETSPQPTALFRTEVAKGSGDDVATIIYTSGTTGEPKGVMLTHANFIYQIDALPHSLPISADDTLLSVLPVWHSYERIIEYVGLCAGATIAYSKPIREVMLADLVATNPTYFPTVPRIWEAVRAGVYRNVEAQGGVKAALFKFFIAVGAAHSKMARLLLGRLPRFTHRPRLLDILAAILPLVLLTPVLLLGKVLVFKKISARLGTRFKAGVSGAGALPGYLDDFFGAAGILVLEGYGLTEAAPVVSIRLLRRPVSGTVGPPLAGTEVMIVKENGERAAAGERGVIHVRGPQLMRGYYKRVGDTATIISGEGWLDTGDIGTLTVDGQIKITGRAKDTIVLLGGENVEPEPIEDLIRQSEYIEHVMVVGQDQRFLGALIVPNADHLAAYATEHGLAGDDLAALLATDTVRKLIQSEVNARVNAKNGFKSFERIARVALLEQPFAVGAELTHTLKMRRHVISDQYESRITELFR